MGNKPQMRPKVSVWARWPLASLSKAVGSLSDSEDVCNVFTKSKQRLTSRPLNAADYTIKKQHVAWPKRLNTSEFQSLFDCSL